MTLHSLQARRSDIMMLSYFTFVFQLLTIFVSGKLNQYIHFYENNKDFVDTIGELLLLFDHYVVLLFIVQVHLVI